MTTYHHPTRTSDDVSQAGIVIVRLLAIALLLLGWALAPAAFAQPRGARLSSDLQAYLSSGQSAPVRVIVTAGTQADTCEKELAVVTSGCTPVAVTPDRGIERFDLGPVVPNPASGESRVEFTVPREGHVEVTVHDIQGRHVALLAAGRYTPGRYQARWSGEIDRHPAPARGAGHAGDVTWRTVYSGGHFFLGEPGPWGGEDYNGDLANFIVTATYKFVFGQLLGIRSNVVSWGQIDGYTDCMEYTINNAAFFGTTDMGPLPADYPAFLDENCNPGVWSRGGWGSVTEIAIQIKGECGTAVEPSTWGKVKSLYGE